MRGRERGGGREGWRGVGQEEGRTGGEGESRGTRGLEEDE